MATQARSPLELNFRKQRFPLFQDAATSESVLRNYHRLRSEVDQLKGLVSELQRQQSHLSQSWKEGNEAETAVLQSFLHLYTTKDPKEKIENEEFKRYATQYALQEGVYLPAYHVTTRMRELGHSLKPSDGHYYYRGLRLPHESIHARATESPPDSPSLRSSQGSPPPMLPDIASTPLQTFGRSSSKI
jgi:hypothetical protein